MPRSEEVTVVLSAPEKQHSRIKLNSSSAWHGAATREAQAGC